MERHGHLAGYSGRRGDAVVRLRTFGRAARVRRALGGLAAWWAAAVGSVLIPVAHFVLVPAFAAAGVIACVRRLRAATVVVAARGTCPDCGAEQQLELDGPWRDIRDVACRHCHRSLRMITGQGRPVT